MQQINLGLRGRVEEGCRVSDVEQIKRKLADLVDLDDGMRAPITVSEAQLLVSTVEEQAERIAELEKYTLETAGKLDGLHEYFQENHNRTGWGKHWGRHIVDVAVQVMKEQQKEIERLRRDLRFYANDRNWTEPTCVEYGDRQEMGPPAVIVDGGTVAKEALKE